MCIWQCHRFLRKHYRLYGFSRIVEMLTFYEDKEMEVLSWRMSFIYGFDYLLTSVAAPSLGQMISHSLVVISPFFMPIPS